ncbi:MAG: hypothetical protein M3O87_07390 [Candidatus Dormibacteraeota bacterium]|nr:hypothetical protein [Candidatus Dormibacteraeota bacterium]
MILLAGERTELGRALKGEMARAQPAGADALINLRLQPANTLLHDGRAWEKLPPGRIVGSTREMLASRAAGDAGFLVHASYAFLRAAEESRRVGEHLRPIVEAALEAEALVQASGRPACVVRIGYVYGPESADLRAYRLAFRLGRPYWAGPKNRLQHHVHSADAAAALLQTAGAARPGKLYYATDNRPASFADFGDRFARKVGNLLPTHIPRISKPLARAIIADEHMEMLEIGVRGPATPHVPGFVPRYPDYRAGLDAVLAEWSQKKKS